MPDTLFTYDGAGRRISMQDGSGLTSWFYNAANELTMLNQAGKVTSYTYNAAGERTSMTAPAGVTNYNYDSIGRLISLVNPHGETTTFTYDGLSRLTSKLLSSGTKEEYTYDTLDRLQTMLTRNSSGGITHSQGYTYNAASEVLSHTIDSETINYGYDAASQLISEVRPGYSASYSYDGNGNRLTRSVNGFTEHYSYDDGDKMLSAGWTTFQYDEAGRRSKKFGSGFNLLETYVYDDEDRLVNRGNQNYTYNGFNTRTKITVNGGSTTEFHRDGVGVTAPVISESTGVSTKHVTPGISEKWGGGASKFMHGGLKDVNAWTDPMQNVTESSKYDAYGRVLPGSSGWANRFGYGGKFGYQSDGGDLQLLGNRYYDSSTGTFLTRDPIKDGRNWYSYCGNNPVVRVDANGLKAGDLFDSPDEAMIDAGKSYARASWDDNKEYAGYLYRVKDPKTGKWKYGYTMKIYEAMGLSMNLDDPEHKRPEGAEVLGNWHTHGKYYALGNRLPSDYLVTSPSDVDKANWKMRYEGYGWSTFYHVAEDGLLSKYTLNKGSDGELVIKSEELYRFWRIRMDGTGLEWLQWDRRKKKKG